MLLWVIGLLLLLLLMGLLMLLMGLLLLVMVWLVVDSGFVVSAIGYKEVPGLNPLQNLCLFVPKAKGKMAHFNIRRLHSKLGPLVSEAVNYRLCQNQCDQMLE